MGQANWGAVGNMS